MALLLQGVAVVLLTVALQPATIVVQAVAGLVQPVAALLQVGLGAPLQFHGVQRVANGIAQKCTMSCKGNWLRQRRSSMPA